MRRHSWRFLEWTARAAHIAIQFQWEPRDLWVGVFWQFRRSHSSGWDYKQGSFSDAPWSLHVYLCLLPTLPLHVYIMRTVRP